MSEQPRPQESPRQGAARVGVYALFCATFAAFVLPFAFAKGSIDADGLNYAMLFRDLFHHGFLYANWLPPPGLGWQLPLLLDLSIFALTGEIVGAMVLIAFVQVCLLFASGRYLLQALVPLEAKARLLRDLALMLVVTWMTHLLSTTDIIVRRVEVHMVVVYFAILNLAVGFLVHALRHGQRRYVAAFGGALLVGFMGSMKFTYFMGLPVVFALGFCAVASLRWSHPKKARLWGLFGLSLAVFLLSYLVLFPLALPKHPFALQYIPGHFSPLWKTFKGFCVHVFWHSLTTGGPWVQAMLLLMVVAAGRLAWVVVGWCWRCEKARQFEDDAFELDFAKLLAGLGSCAVFAAIMLKSTGVVSRYYIPIAYFLLAYVLLSICVHLGQREAPLLGGTRLWVVLVAVPLLLMSVLLSRLDAYKEIKHPFADVAQFDPKTGDLQALTFCLDAHKQLHGLRYGLAEFWTARPIQMMSRKGLRVYQIDPKDFQYYNWIVNLSYFWAGSKKLGEPFYNFIITGYHRVPRSFVEWWAEMDDGKRQKYVAAFRKRYGRRPQMPADLERVLGLYKFVSMQNINEAKVRYLFGKPSATFRCKQSYGFRRILVYHKSTGFDAKIKGYFKTKYRHVQKKTGFSLRK